ncbi:MAG: hypothetical protein WCA84_06645 [Ignavibacteriaceae bacterium]
MTPNLDSIAIEFIKRIPTTFKSAFTAGGGPMPDTYFMPAVNIIDYINRGMKKLFNDYWLSTKGDPLAFSRLFPELTKYTPAINISGGLYTIVNPYLDFKRIVGGLISNGNIFIKIWDDTKLTIALSGLYDEYIASPGKPAIIQLNNQLFLFPDALSSGSLNSVRLHYIALPVSPATGSALVQNGNYDSPFCSQWNSVIADYAEQLFLQDSYQTT